MLNETSVGEGAIVMQIFFTETKKEIVFLFGSNDSLTSDLFFDSRERGGTNRRLTKLIDSDMDEMQGKGEIDGIRVEVDGKEASIGECIEIGFDGINKPFPFPQSYIEPAVHAGSTKYVVKEYERKASVVISMRSMGTDEYVRLPVIASKHFIKRFVLGRYDTGYVRTVGVGDTAKVTFGEGYDAVEADTSGRKKDHVGRVVVTLNEETNVFGRKTVDGIVVTKDVVSERMSVKKEVFKVVEDIVVGHIFDGFEFVMDNPLFFFQFFLREGRMEKKVCNEIKGTFKMLGGESTVYGGLFLGSKGVDFSTDNVHALDDMPGFALSGSLKNGMLDEVCEAILIVSFVAGPDVDSDAAITDRRVLVSMYYTEAVREGVGEEAFIQFEIHTRIFCRRIRIASCVSWSA
jgi:hypothetical protein